ncbi:MAG: MFS transporter [Actinobacteria bacterium]|nr:MFS transporter [Actinomycetota bacterium]
MEKQNLAWDKNLAIIFGVTFVSIIGTAAISPALPKIVASLGLPKETVGLLFTYYTLPAIFLAPLIGILADRLGRKLVLVVALIYYGLVGWAITLTSNLALILALRFLHGIGGAALITFSAVLIGDMFRGDVRLKAMGANVGILNVSGAILPVVGGALALLGWYYPFYLSLLSIAVGVVALRLEIPEPERRAGVIEYFRNALRASWRVGAIGAFTASAISFLVLYGAFLTYYTLFLSSFFHATSFNIGIIISTQAVASAIVSFLAGRLRRYASEARLVQVSFVIFAASQALIPLTPSLWFSLIPAAIFGIALGIFYPSLLTIVTSLAPIEERASVTALNTSMIAIGQTAGPLIAGFIFARSGITAVFFAAAAISIAEFVFSLFTVRPPRH